MDILKHNPLKTFLTYAIPSVVGMFAISSATIVDGYFVGNNVGAIGLAAINISTPIFSLLFGLALMLSVGASVLSGKLMGEGDTRSASVIFSKTVLSMAFISLFIIGLIYFNMNSIINIFEPPKELFALVELYLTYMLIFIPFLMIGIIFSYFVKIDSQPYLAFGAMLFSALINIVLDWVLIAHMGQGIFGAALATGISQASFIFILLPHFFTKKATIRFVNPFGSYKIILKASFNGASEFVNETSVGITALIFNYILMQRLGVDGVAAYAVVNYMLWISLMVSFGVSDSLIPLVSKSYGSKDSKIISKFLKYALITVTLSGIALMVFALSTPKTLAAIFLDARENQSITIVVAFLSFVWPVFLFNGANLVISAYLTAMHKPIPSATIAILRSLILPIFLILALPIFLGDNGIFLAIVLAEFLTLIVALSLFRAYSPKRVIV